jgi:hypothetical protein
VHEITSGFRKIANKFEMRARASRRIDFFITISLPASKTPATNLAVR